MKPRIQSVRYLDEYQLELTFTNLFAGEVDLKDSIVGRGGVFRPLEDLAFFRRVSVDAEAGTLIWPNGVDFCPDVLYDQAKAARLLAS